jgi:hypothetical protein
MHQRSTLIRPRRIYPKSAGTWLPLLIGLIFLSLGSAGAWSFPASFEDLGLPGNSGLDTAQADIETVIADLTLITTDLGETLDVQPLYSSPVDPETPDLELVMLKANKRCHRPLVPPALMSKASTLLRGGCVPLYLTHQSLLC